MGLQVRSQAHSWPRQATLGAVLQPVGPALSPPRPPPRLLCAVIYFPWLNRGTNFSPEEREQLRLEGLLPTVVESLDLQAERWGRRRCSLLSRMGAARGVRPVLCCCTPVVVQEGHSS